MKTIAIVIPAFKLEFLDRALAALHANDLTDAMVYVADDASPHPLKEVVARWQDHLPLQYVRFPQNLGGQDLAAHWNRSVRLSSEPWVWLPGDDDEFEPDCVRALLSQIRSDGAKAGDLYRLNVIKIDAESNITTRFSPYPASLSAREFLRHRFEGTLQSFAPEYVFRRAAWDVIGGFVPFPLAWCTDDATWALLSKRSGITTVEGPCVRWRQSGLNITSRTADHAERKAEAATLFVNWVKTNWHLIDSGELFENTDLRQSALSWLFAQIAGNPHGWTRLKAFLKSLQTANGWRTEWLIETMRRLYWTQRKVRGSFS